MVSKVPIFVLIVGTASAVTWSNKLPPTPKEFANLTGCYIKEVNRVIPFNDSVNALGFCYLIHCTNIQIDYVSCGLRATDHENCIVTEADLNEPYPDCCPKVKCYENDIPWLHKSNTTIQRTNTAERRPTA